MGKAGNTKKLLFTILNLLFPMLVNLICGTYFLIYWHKNGYVILGAGARQEALDYLVK